MTAVFIVLTIRCLLPNNVYILKSKYKSLLHNEIRFTNELNTRYSVSVIRFN